VKIVVPECAPYGGCFGHDDLHDSEISRARSGRTADTTSAREV